MKKRTIGRRVFVKGAAGAAVAMFIPSRAFGANNRLNVACIGCGGKGAGDVSDVSGENIVALCDVDEKQAEGTFRRFPDVKKYRDFRKMFDEMGNQIDAVTVSTPDHMHYPASYMAIMLGKHVFCQKPLTHNIWEARRLTELAREKKVATQMGIQGHSNEGTRLLCEWVWAGAIGPVREVHYWTNRPIWPQGINRPSDRPPVPPTLDWDVWLGPAPDRPYHPAYLPFRWRGWWDFGCGALGDIGCHAMDAAFWALKLAHPTSVEAQTSPVNDETAPSWSIVTYQFPARGELPPVKVIWHDGGKRPPRPKDLEPDRDIPGDIGGQLLFGDAGTIMADVYCGSPRIIPEAKMREFLPKRPPKTLPRSPGHMREWIEACKGGPAPGANFDFAGPLTEMVLLGNLAVRTGQRIMWDPVNMKVTNVPEANRYVRREPRKGWEEFYRVKEPPKEKPRPAAQPRPAQAPVDRAAAEAEKLFNMARQAEQMGQRDAAVSFYKKLVSEYPGSTFAARATERLAALGH